MVFEIWGTWDKNLKEHRRQYFKSVNIEENALRDNCS